MVEELIGKQNKISSSKSRIQFNEERQLELNDLISQKWYLSMYPEQENRESEFANREIEKSCVACLRLMYTLKNLNFNVNWHLNSMPI